MALAGHFQRRRAALFERLQAPVLLFSGAAPARNTPDVRYAYRCSSHVLFFAGALAQDTYLLIEPGGSRIFLPEPPQFDELWHGPGETARELLERIGCDAVLPVASLLKELSQYPCVHFLEPFEAEARRRATMGLSSCVVLKKSDPALLDALIASRLMHDEYGKEQLEAAASKTARVFNETFAFLPEAFREQDVAAYLGYRTAALDTTPAFAPIVTQTPDVLHAPVTGRPLKIAPMLLIDYGIECKSGYCCDVTRSLPQNGSNWRVSGEAVWEFYAMLLEVQQRCIAALSPGIRFLEMQLLAERLLLEGLRQLEVLRGTQEQLEASGIVHYFFLHGLGHPIGLDVHDMQDLGDRVGYPPGRTRPKEFGRCFLRFDRDLEAGMALTVEPGCYFSPLRLEALLSEERLRPLVNHQRLELFSEIGGARIEDTVLLTEGGVRVLSDSIPKTVASLREITEIAGS